jgi:hypothetical protein
VEVEVGDGHYSFWAHFTLRLHWQEQGACCHDSELVVWYLFDIGHFLKRSRELLPENINKLLGNTADVVCSERVGTWRYEVDVDRVLASSSCLRSWSQPCSIL